MTGRDFSLDNINLSRLISTRGNGNNDAASVSKSSQILFNGSQTSYGKGVAIEGTNFEALLKFIQNAGIDYEKVNDAKFVTLKDGTRAVSITLKPEKGNVTTMLFNKEDESLIEHSTTNKQGIVTTTSYDGDRVLHTVIKQQGQSIKVDDLSRIIRRESENGTVEYQYGDETVIPAKIIENLKNGNQVIHQNGEKVTKTPDGKTTTESDSLTRKIQDILNDTTEVSTKKPSELRDILKDIDLSKFKPIKKKREPKDIAKMLQKEFYASASSPNRSKNLQNVLSLITSENVDWVLYEYKKLTKHDLFADLKIVFKNSPLVLKTYNKHFAQLQYEKYGVNLNFKNQNSVVSNKYHKGDPYSIVQEGTIITVRNKKTGKTKQIDLDVLLKNYPDARDRAKIIKQLQSLPGEVLMDISIETDSFIPAKGGEQITVEGGMACNAAGFYRGSDDTIHLDASGTTQTLVHEMGHAVDYNHNGIGNNLSSVAKDKKFMRLFNAEMRNFISAGNQRYVYTPDGNGSGTRGAYATANEREMFAECYTLLMTGNCGSRAVIEKYFPKCLAYINSKIEQNRSYRENYRH